MPSLFRFVVLATWFLAVLSSPAFADRKEGKKQKRRVKVSGYLQLFYKLRIDTNGDDAREPDLFRVQRARVKLEGRIAPRVRFDLEIDPRAPEIGGVMRDAFLSIAVIPHHKLRLGQQKTPFGYENGESSTRLYTVVRSELAEGLGRGLTLRDIGVAVVGEVPLGSGFTFEDHVAVVNGAGMNVQVDDTERKNVWARVGARYDDPDAALMVRAGVSGAIGDQREPDDPGPPLLPGFRFTFWRLGADVEVEHRWVFVAAEYAMGADAVPADPDAGGDAMAYSLLIAGKTPWDVGPVVRYDAADAEEFKRWTFGGYAGRPTARLRAMATYEIFEDEAGPHDHRLLLWTQARF